MSLNKAIEYRKEHRRPYYGAKRVAPSCRNHGGCPWCEGNRMYRAKKEEERTKMDLNEYEEDIEVKAEKVYDRYAAKYRHEFTYDGDEYAAISKGEVDLNGYPAYRVFAISRKDIPEMDEDGGFPVYEALFYADESSVSYDWTGYPVYDESVDSFNLDEASEVGYYFEQIAV